VAVAGAAFGAGAVEGVGRNDFQPIFERASAVDVNRLPLARKIATKTTRTGAILRYMFVIISYSTPIISITICFPKRPEA
jgi:hypothetical protein